MNISCEITSSDTSVSLGLEVWVDDFLIVNSDHVEEPITINHDISDDDGEHELRFVLKNKTDAHTEIDQNGNIIKDSMLTVTNLKFEDIALEQVFYDLATYEHDFNGTGKKVQNKFYGNLGCNGTVTLKFSTPMYLWLLENM
jgi:hypothetical protein